MKGSIFYGLSLTRDAGCITVNYPERIHAFSRAVEFGARHDLTVSRVDTGWSLRYPAPDDEIPGELRAFFAELNGHPPAYSAKSAALAVHRQPLVSCIVVVNENLPFLRDQLLPSLITHSMAHAIEVILVSNGAASPDPGWPGVRTILSQFGVVSAAYNAGAAHGRGEYLAFFHDDCVVDDALWIDKCLQRLRHGAVAVSGEYREMTEIAGMKCPPIPVAKTVPLFMRADDFERTGGFDEFHYIGYEDIDFTLGLVDRGGKVVMTDLQIRHFSGMSSTLKYCAVRGLRDLYALGAVPRGAIVQRFNEFTAAGLRMDGVDYLRAALEVQLLYVLVKHRRALARVDSSAYARAESALRDRIAAHGAGDGQTILEKFKVIDRELSNDQTR
jgi:hypothetical protein